MKTRVLTESGCGLTKEEANALGIDFLPLQVQVEDKTYLDGIDLTVTELNSLLERGYMPQTSMPPLGDIEDLLESYKNEGVTDVILVTLSNGLSGTNQAIQASGKWRGVKIHTLDIFTTLGVEKYLVLAAQKLVEKEVHPDEIIARLQDSVEHSRGFLIPEDLNHLAKGGRLTPMAAKLGGMLKIKPILEVSKNSQGKVDVCDKVRTMSKAIKKAIKIMAKDANVEDYVFYVLDSDAEQDAAMACEELKATIGENIEIHRDPIYSVIAVHTGLKAIGLQYVKKVEGI
jgi:DegV family protein with EDD domain